MDGRLYEYNINMISQMKTKLLPNGNRWNAHHFNVVNVLKSLKLCNQVFTPKKYKKKQKKRKKKYFAWNRSNSINMWIVWIAKIQNVEKL